MLYQLQTITKQGFHARFDGGLFNQFGWGLFIHQLGNAVVHPHQLVYTTAALVAATTTFFAEATVLLGFFGFAGRE